MSLEKHHIYNDLSEKLRKELVEKVDGLGKIARFQFNISNPNPDPEKREGPTLWPMMYTLDPLIFNINDPYEKGAQKSKKIGLVKETDGDGKPTKFSRIQVFRRQRGVLELYLENEEDRYKAMYLLLHPKTGGGMFEDKTRNAVVTLIDERKLAKEKTEARSLKVKAMSDAQGLSEEEVMKFAKAMTWDTTLDVGVLKSQIEDLAEYEPEYYMELRNEDGEKAIEYLSVIQDAVDKHVVEFDPSNYCYVWASNKHTIYSLPPDGTKTEKEKFAVWLQNGDDKAKETYKRIKTLVK